MQDRRTLRGARGDGRKGPSLGPRKYATHFTGLLTKDSFICLSDDKTANLTPCNLKKIRRRTNKNFVIIFVVRENKFFAKVFLFIMGFSDFWRD